MKTLTYPDRLEIHDVEVDIGTPDESFEVLYNVIIPLESDSFSYQSETGLRDRKVQILNADKAKAICLAIGPLTTKEHAIEAIDKAVFHIYEQGDF